MESINSVRSRSLNPYTVLIDIGKAVLFVESGVQVICLSCGVRTSSKVDRAYQKGVSQKSTATSSVEQVIEDWNRRV